MRCPKCQYLNFDNGERCRNCGYEFSLAVAPEPLDLAIQDGSEPIGPLADLALNAQPVVERSQPPGPLAPDTGSLELPLFNPRGVADRPLVTPAAPRPPLSVRRGAPPPPKPKPGSNSRGARPVIDEPRLALDTAEMPVVDEPDRGGIEADPESREPANEPSRTAPRLNRSRAPERTDPEAPAPVAARVFAGVIDLAIVGGIDAAVLYLTLRVLEMHIAEARALPLVPFIAFLLLLNGSYFAAFVAASGQTIGKMAAGIRVVPGDPVAHSGDRVPVGAAIVRAAAYVVSILPAGLGFLPGVMGKDHRALHDRLADTRVVKA